MEGCTAAAHTSLELEEIGYGVSVRAAGRLSSFVPICLGRPAVWECKDDRRVSYVNVDLW